MPASQLATVPDRLAGKVEYVMALDALSLAARRFADAAGRASAIAARLDPSGTMADDAQISAIAGEVRDALLLAFARAPGLLDALKR